MKQMIRLTAGVRLTLYVAIPVLISTMMWLLSREARSRGELVRHTLQVELSLEQMMSGLKDAESGLRGYLLTSESGYQDSSRAASAASRRELEILSSIVQSTRQRDTLGRLRPLVEMRLGQVEQNLAPARPRTLAGADKTTLDDGARLMDSIQSAAVDMRVEADRLLALRETALSSSANRLRWALFLGYGLVVLVVLWLYRTTLRYIRQRTQAEERLSRLNAELDQRVRDRTAALEAREDLLKTFVRHVPAAVAMLDRAMKYLQVSDRWCADYALRSGDVIGRSHYEVFADIPEQWKEIHCRGLAGEALHAQEDKWVREDGQVTWLHWDIRPWGNRDGLPEGILIFAEDITARKQTEELLRQSEATTRALLETASQAILTVDETGAIVFANPMASEMFGYSGTELLGMPHEILVPGRLRERHVIHRANFAANPKTRPMGIGLELSGQRKDGTEFPIEVSLSSVDTARGRLSVSFISDISARRQADVALRNSEQQLRALAGSLLTAQEDERRRLARELHDGVTQLLAFLSIELGRLASDLPHDTGLVSERLRTLHDQAFRMSNEVRRVSHGLHPWVIEDFGLSVALEEFCDEFQRAQAIRVAFDGLIEDSRLDPVAATCLYRIAQESLRNAVIHGHATEVRVELHAAAESIQLRVLDNGVGLPAQETRAKSGLGVVSMKERIRLVNGTLTLSSTPGQGAQVTAEVPVPEVKREQYAYSGG